MRRVFLVSTLSLFLVVFLVALFYKPVLWANVILVPLALCGFYDYFQERHTIRRNFPILGRFRYWFEFIRPEINQYFVESDTDGAPFSRELRSIVYQRAKDELDTLPFGTKKDVYAVGYEWVNHSLCPVEVEAADLRVRVGSQACKKPYDASLLNISAMSYGALSKNAVLALNGAAKDGHFAHNTGEGGLSSYHLSPGGDLIWQIGTGYFGCRTEDGRFSEDLFEQKSAHENVKMIELKLSQGAKPGHGGILPAAKVTQEIAEIRHVPLGKDVISPPAHKEFQTPIELLQFVQRMRNAAGGKPVGVKLCVGKRREFLAICKAIEKTGIVPDFISVDGGEGGTGAAPLEFSNHVGSPGLDALIFVHNALVGFGIREEIRVFSAGKVVTAFGMIKRLALGADVVYSARGMMLALGCIQALRCNSNLCPTGVATQDPQLTVGLVVKDKRARVAEFHRETIKALAEMLGAIGLRHSAELKPWHIMRRISPSESKHYGELFEYLEKGSLLRDPLPKTYERALRACSAESFMNVA